MDAVDTISDLEKYIAKFRLKTISIELNNKVIKTGEVLNWKIHPYYFEVVLKTEKKDEDLVKIFYPFDYEFYGDDFEPELFLDYRIDTLNKKEMFHFDVNEISVFKTHKFFDQILKITTNNE